MDENGDIIYQLRKPWSDGTTGFKFSPQEFLEKVAALVPLPKFHLIHFHGVLAPNAKLRPLVIPKKPAAAEPPAGTADKKATDPAVQSKKCGYDWAALLKRVFDIDMSTCPSCKQGKLKIIAAITKRSTIRKILKYLQLSVDPPVLAPSCI